MKVLALISYKILGIHFKGINNNSLTQTNIVKISNIFISVPKKIKENPYEVNRRHGNSLFVIFRALHYVFGVFKCSKSLYNSALSRPYLIRIRIKWLMGPIYVDAPCGRGYAGTDKWNEPNAI